MEKIYIYDPEMYVWKVKPLSKLSIYHVFSFLILVFFLPFFYFTLFFLGYFVFPKLFIGICIFFLSVGLFMEFLFSIYLPFANWVVKRVKHEEFQSFWTEFNLLAKGGFFMTLRRMVLAIVLGSLLLLILADYRSVGSGFSIRLDSWYAVLLYYTDTLLQIFLLDIPSKLEFSLINIKPVSKTATIVSITISILFTVSVIKNIYRFVTLRKEKVFVGTVLQFFYYLGDYVEVFNFGEDRKLKYEIEISGVLYHDEKLPFLMDLDLFYSKCKEESELGII